MAIEGEKDITWRRQKPRRKEKGMGNRANEKPGFLHSPADGGNRDVT